MNDNNMKKLVGYAMLGGIFRENQKTEIKKQYGNSAKSNGVKTCEIGSKKRTHGK